MTCFVAGTMILTVAGLVAIENIKAGDKVTSTNTDTFETAEKTVLETFSLQGSMLVHVWIYGRETLVTPEHPYWISEKGWINAGDLIAGDHLRKKDGELVPIQKIEHEILEEPVPVYNFRVEDFNTYYAGDVSVLVHNSCGPPHQMEGKVTRNGEPVEGLGGSYSSGGEPGCGQLDYQQQLDTHTEAKFLKDIQGQVSPGDHIEMTGTRNPCQPGCQPKIRQFVSDNGITATYNANGTGLQYNWTPQGNGSVIQTVIDTGSNATVSSYSYYQRASGSWGRISLL